MTELTGPEQIIQEIIYDNWPADRNTYRSAQDIAKRFNLNDNEGFNPENDFVHGLQWYAEKVHKTAVSHGWWEIDGGDRNFGEMLALMHSELSEALEAWRDHEPTLWYDYGTGEKRAQPILPASEITIGDVEPGETILGKPCGVASEFADVIIRILDTCAKLDIPIVKALQHKADYNETRPYRHGGKRA